MRLACLMLPVVLSLPLPATAVTLRLCQDARSHAPLMTAAGDGVLDLLIREAAKEAGISITAYAAPVARCREEIRAGVADGFPAAPYVPEVLPYLTWPMRKAQPDLSRSIQQFRVMAMRRAGDAVNWNGKKLSDLHGPLLANAGSVMPNVVAQRLQLPMDSSAATMAQNVEKLLVGRGGLLIGWEVDLLAAQKHSPDRLEILDTPLAETQFYVPVSAAFYRQHPDLIETYWNILARLARTEPWQSALAESARNLSPD